MNDPDDTVHESMFPIRQRRFDVFISHAREDAGIARALAEAIEARGFTVWHMTKLKVGEPMQAIEHALRSSGAIIVLLSAASISSPFIAREIETALTAFPRSAVFPVAVGEVDVRTTPPWLATRKWLYLHDSLRIGRLVEQLLPGLDAVTGARGSDAGTATVHGQLPPRTPLVGVDDHLQRLRSQLVGMTLIVGEAGTGKTMLAREYAFHMRNEMDFIWWWSASITPVEDLIQQLQRIEDETVPGERGLIVVDELDAIDARLPLQELEAISRRHRVVVTSRRILNASSLRDQQPTVLTLGPLSQADVAHYFDIFMPQLPGHERAGLARIADSMGRSGFALRLITQALQTHSIEAVQAAASTGRGIVDTSVQLLLDRLSADERHRLDVLSFCSRFLTLVRSNKQWILPQDDTLFAVLIDWGLCTTEADGTVVLRRPIVDFLRGRATRQAFEDALAYLAPRLPDPNDPNAQSYLSGVTELTDIAELDWGPDTAGNLAELLIWQASLWLASGEPERADMVCSRALAMAAESGQVLLRIRALNLQSALAFNRGRIDEASAIELRTADLATIELGPEHPISISALANLATTRRAQGDLPEAITLLRRAVALGQRILPDNHPDLETTRINLAVCLRDAGMAKEALALLNEAGRNATDNRMGLQADQIRAAVLMDVGRPEEAAELLTEALKRVTSIGLSGTTDALTARTNLATLYARIGRLDEALALQSEVVEQLDVISGPDHPATLSARNNYAGLLAEEGSLTNAYELWFDVATSRDRVLGAEHPDTLQSWLRVAAAASAKGDSRQALKLYGDLLERVVRVLGPNHPTSYSVREEFARELGRAGEVESSRRAYRELLADFDGVLPSDHPTVRRVAAVVGDDGP